ncbi:U2 snRNP component prp10, partial [Coemansia sp. RSA 2599]
MKATAAAAASEKKQQQNERLPSASKVGTDIKYDTDIYGSSDRFAGYDTSIAADGSREYEEEPLVEQRKGRFGITAPKELIDEVQGASEAEAEDLLKEIQRTRGTNRVIADRESEYQKRRHARQLSPERADAFGAKGSSENPMSYAESM